MSTEYAGANTFHATCTLPSDGDNRSATVWNAPLEDLADRTAWLNTNTAKLSAVNTFTAANTFNTATVFAGTVTQRDPLILDQDGRIRRRVVNLTDASADADTSAGDVFVLPLLTADRVITIKGEIGEQVTLIAYANNRSYKATVAPDSGGSLFSSVAPELRNTAGYWRTMVLECIAYRTWAAVAGYRA
jgi:hypothetical protein